MSEAKLIILRGYPGSGKTTVGKHLASEGLGTFIDHNQILTFLAKITGDDDGIYDEIHELEKAMAKKLLSEGKSVIVARGFSSASSLRPYTEMAEEVNSSALIFRLEVDEVLLRRRVVASERKLDFNPTTNEEVLLDWIKNNPLVAVEGEHTVNANQSVDEVVENISQIIVDL